MYATTLLQIGCGGAGISKSQTSSVFVTVGYMLATKKVFQKKNGHAIHIRCIAFFHQNEINVRGIQLYRRCKLSQSTETDSLVFSQAKTESNQAHQLFLQSAHAVGDTGPLSISLLVSRS